MNIKLICCDDIVKQYKRLITQYVFDILVFSAVSAGIRGGCLSLVISRLSIRLRNCLFASIMKQEVGFFDSVKTGDLK